VATGAAAHAKDRCRWCWWCTRTATQPHIEDVARRLALADFIAFAPDALFPLAAIRAMRTRRAPCPQVGPGQDQEDFIAAAKLLADIEGGNAAWRVGFCYGGAWSISCDAAAGACGGRAVLWQSADA